MKNRIIIIIIISMLFIIGFLYRYYTNKSKYIAKGKIIDVISDNEFLLKVENANSFKLTDSEIIRVYVYEADDDYYIDQYVEVYCTGMMKLSDPPIVDAKKVKIK